MAFPLAPQEEKRQYSLLRLVHHKENQMLARGTPASAGGRGRGGGGGAPIVVFAPGAHITAGAAPLVMDTGTGQGGGGRGLLDASKQLLLRIGILKQQPDLDLKQRTAIRGVETTIAQLDARETAIKQKFKQACATHPALLKMKSDAQRLAGLKQLYPADYTELTTIKASRRNNVKIIETIMMQKTKIEGHRSRTAALGVLQEGNTALSEEMKKAREAYDVSKIADDTTELFQESVDDDREFFEDIDGIQTGSDALGDLTIQSLDGESLTIDDALAAEIGEMTTEIGLAQREEAAALLGQLGGVYVPQPSTATRQSPAMQRVAQAAAASDEGAGFFSAAPSMRSSPSPSRPPASAPRPIPAPRGVDMSFEEDYFS
jgi:hypothetical protein